MEEKGSSTMKIKSRIFLRNAYFFTRLHGDTFQNTIIFLGTDFTRILNV